jgi:hypothetical protein
VVEIDPTDKGFNTGGCGRWMPVANVLTPQTVIPDGTWLVSDEVSPGTYSAPGSDECYWERLSGFSGELDDIIANDFGSGKQLVTIESTDAGFHTANCGEWTQTG